jgi:hypothetical protein
VAGRIKQIEKSNGLIGSRTRDLAACSIVPQIEHQAVKMFGGVAPDGGELSASSHFLFAPQGKSPRHPLDRR